VSFKGISVCCLCDCKDEDWLKIISDAQSLQNLGYGMTTSYFVGAILTKFTYLSSGEKSTIHLWLIFGGWAIGIELPITLLATWLSHLRVGIATLGNGVGKALLRVGSFLRGLVCGLIKTLQRS